MNFHSKQKGLSGICSNCKVTWHDRLSTGLIGLLAIGLTGCRTPCAAAVTQGLTLCSQTLVPALFPFFVLGSLAIETGIVYRAGKFFSRPMSRLFHLPGSSAALFLLGALGGYPTGARAVAQSYRQRQCTKDEAQRMLSLCSNCGPGFFLGVAGGTVLGNTYAGLALWIIHLVSALLTALLFRGRTPVPPAPAAAPTPLSFPKALVKAVSGAVQSTLGVCGFVLFFSVLLCLLQESGIFSLAVSLLGLFGQDEAFSSALAAGLIEISCGVSSLSASSAPLPLKGAAAAFLLSLGGCSVLFQTIQQTEDTDLSPGGALARKLIQAVFAAVIGWLYLRSALSTGPGFSLQLPRFLPQMAGILLLLCLVFCLFTLVKGKKSRYNKHSTKERRQTP